MPLANVLGNQNGAGARSPVSFVADTTTSLDNATGAAFNYSRSSTAIVTDFEGVYKTMLANEAGFQGARRVQNLCAVSEDITQWRPLQGATITSSNTFTYTGGSNSYVDNYLLSQVTSAKTGQAYKVSAKIAQLSGDGQIRCVLRASTSGQFIYTNVVSPTSTLTRYDFGVCTLTADETSLIYIQIQSVNSTVNGEFQVEDILFEEVTGQTNQNPSEYVSAGVPKTAVTNISDTSTWSLNDPNITVVNSDTVNFNGSEANFTYAQIHDTSNNQFVPYAGATVIATYTISNYVQGSMQLKIGGVNGTYNSANGTYTEIAEGCDGSASVIFQNSNNGFEADVTLNSFYYAEHGAVVGGVQYFDYENGNTVDGTTFAITEATGTAIPQSTIKGLIIENTSTNEFLYSEDLTNVAWTANLNVTPTTGGTTGPDGLSSMNQVLETAVTGAHTIGASYTYAATTYYTASVVVKGGLTRQYVNLTESSTGVAQTSVFDIVNGTVQSANANHVAQIEALSQGTYRISIAFQSGTAGTSDVTLGIQSDATTTSYLGVITDGIYASMFQFEVNGYPTSYIATTTATVTRAAVTASVPVSSIFSTNNFYLLIAYATAYPSVTYQKNTAGAGAMFGWLNTQLFDIRVSNGTDGTTAFYKKSGGGAIGTIVNDTFGGYSKGDVLVLAQQASSTGGLSGYVKNATTSSSIARSNGPNETGDFTTSLFDSYFFGNRNAAAASVMYIKAFKVIQRDENIANVESQMNLLATTYA